MDSDKNQNQIVHVKNSHFIGKEEKDTDTEKHINGNDDEIQELNVQNFIRKNGEQKGLIEKRDGHISFIKWIFALIFCYLLISPILPLFSSVSDKAWCLAILLIPLILVMWSYIEYYSRSEAWYCCIVKGIILDLEKTHTATKWLCRIPVFFVYFFMLTVAVLYGISYNPPLNDKGQVDEFRRYLAAILYLLGFLFVLNMTKAFVDLEGAPNLLTLNMFLFYLDDNKLLEARGYKVIHFTNLCKYIQSRNDQQSFSWNDLYKLSDKPDPDASINLTWGWRVSKLLIANKDKME